MSKNKFCPVCGSSTWNYDVVEYSTGETFCGDCIAEVRRMGRLHNLLVWSDKAFGYVFPNNATWYRAISLACELLYR
jgi:hypothetical protein